MGNRQEHFLDDIPDRFLYGDMKTLCDYSKEARKNSWGRSGMRPRFWCWDKISSQTYFQFHFCFSFRAKYPTDQRSWWSLRRCRRACRCRGPACTWSTTRPGPRGTSPSSSSNSPPRRRHPRSPGSTSRWERTQAQNIVLLFVGGLNSSCSAVGGVL